MSEMAWTPTLEPAAWASDTPPLFSATPSGLSAPSTPPGLLHAPPVFVKEEGDIPETVVHTPVQTVKTILEVTNFAALCAMSPTYDQAFGEFVSGPLLVADGIPFAVGVDWYLKESGGVDYDQPVGFFARCLAENLETVRLCHRMHLTVRNWQIPPWRSDHRSITVKDEKWMMSDARDLRRFPCDWIDLTLGELLRDDSSFLNHGALIIEAKLEFVPGSSSHRRRFVKKGQPALCKSLKALFASGVAADLEIYVQGERLNAHTQILCARSQWFCAMLTSSFRERQEKKVTISDISAEVMKALLEYIYTGAIKKPLDDDEFCCGLLRASHRFEMQDLLQECEEVMASRVSVNTAVSWLQLAKLLSCSDLQAACKRCIKENADAVQGTESFVELTDPTLLKEVLAAVASSEPRGRKRARSG